MLLVHQNTGKENHYGKNFFAVLISTLGRFDRANKKKICHIHFNEQTNNGYTKLNFIGGVSELDLHPVSLVSISVPFLFDFTVIIFILIVLLLLVSTLTKYKMLYPPTPKK